FCLHNQDDFGEQFVSSVVSDYFSVMTFPESHTRTALPLAAASQRPSRLKARARGAPVGSSSSRISWRVITSQTRIILSWLRLAKRPPPGWYASASTGAARPSKIDVAVLLSMSHRRI